MLFGVKDSIRANAPAAVMISYFIWPFLQSYMGVIPNPKMAFIFPISCFLAQFPKCSGKVSIVTVPFLTASLLG